MTSLPTSVVRRVEGLFALADPLELRLAKARGQVDQLTPSLLASAFASQLVLQAPPPIESAIGQLSFCLLERTTKLLAAFFNQSVVSAR